MIKKITEIYDDNSPGVNKIQVFSRQNIFLWILLFWWFFLSENCFFSLQTRDGQTAAQEEISAAEFSDFSIFCFLFSFFQMRPTDQFGLATPAPDRLPEIWFLAQTFFHSAQMFITTFQFLLQTLSFRFLDKLLEQMKIRCVLKQNPLNFIKLNRIVWTKFFLKS